MRKEKKTGRNQKDGMKRNGKGRGNEFMNQTEMARGDGWIGKGE